MEYINKIKKSQKWNIIISSALFWFSVIRAFEGDLLFPVGIFISFSLYLIWMENKRSLPIFEKIDNLLSKKENITQDELNECSTLIVELTNKSYLKYNNKK